ncbi:MAG: VacJ family lipoprotein [Moraxellaceae bacterium]|nr:MAG: VacJ family lipoprotein [Moraxellaceae bacterium]
MDIMKTSLLTASVLSFSMLINSALAQPEDSTNAPGAPVVESEATIVRSPIDPWEKFNRSIFKFNQGADRYVLKPVAKAYVRLTPTFFRRGVDNALSNVMEIPSAFNGLLQGNFRGAAHDTGRLLVNSTLGLAGILDVAQYMNLKQTDNEDFGQTLAVWGISSGPYLVLPLLGPSSLRDTSAVPVDWYTDPKSYIDHIRTKNTVRATSIINARANLMPLEKGVSGDKYVFYREAYLQRRNFLINNGKVEDSFGEESTEDSGF